MTNLPRGLLVKSSLLLRQVVRAVIEVITIVTAISLPKIATTHHEQTSIWLIARRSKKVQLEVGANKSSTE